MAIERALLLIADIGGYTRFMKVHRVNLAHAQDIVGRLLEAVIDGARPGFKLAKLEGDAALFYAIVGGDDKKRVARLGKEVVDIHRAFSERRQNIEDARMCNCDACIQSGRLRLKFVTHLGEVAFQKVKQYTELAGVDVILVHRLLKNSVTLPEYVLMTEPVADRVDHEVRRFASERTEELDEIGATKTFFVDMRELVAPGAEAAHTRPSFLRRFFALMLMNLRSIPYVLGLRKPCDTFRNMSDATGMLPSLPPSLPPALHSGTPKGS